MDTITHGILGAALSQSVMMRRLPRGAGWIGAVAAMAPDLDIFIRSSTDPTVAWLYHRHFTHSLIFTPLGGLVAALPFLWLSRYRDRKKEVILAAILAYASHGFLDSLTNYGTQQLWPFSDYRVAWDTIGIVDPIYSVLLLVGVSLAARSGRMRPARIALLLSSLYLCFGAWQHHRAVGVQNQLLTLRGQQAQHSRVLPMPGWLIFWRSVYIADGRLYVDGIRTPWFGAPLFLAGGSADATTFEDLPPAAQSNPESKRRFQILDWFADRLIAPVEWDANGIGDMRITLTVEGLTPLWGLHVDPSSGEVQALGPPPIRDSRIQTLIRGVIFGDPRYQPLKTNSRNSSP